MWVFFFVDFIFWLDPYTRFAAQVRAGQRRQRRLLREQQQGAQPSHGARRRRQTSEPEALYVELSIVADYAVWKRYLIYISFLKFLSGEELCNIYKGLRILSRYCSCQDSEFRSALETSSADIDKLLSKNFFLWIQCPNISLLLFKDGADLRMESFSCNQSPHTLLLGANGFTLLTTCHSILKLMFFFFFIFQT